MQSNNIGCNPFVMKRRWWRLSLIILWVMTGIATAVLALSSLQDLPYLQLILEPFRYHVSGDKALYSPLAYFCLFSITAFLEQKIPVSDQPILSTSFVQDMLWYAGTVVFRITFLAVYVSFLHEIYQQHLSFLTIEGISDMHPGARFIVALLIVDFVRWLIHLIVHKVPVFWVFHTVHHSQTSLNLFTDARVHPLERMIAATGKFIPFLMLDTALPLIMAWAVFETVYPKFYHANIRLNLGVLRYILVTPQSHRIHHGVGPAYRDKNFGFTFCIWDRLFGTQYRDHNDYPPTGIIDDDFPLESEKTLSALFKIFFLQLIYPFQKLFRLLYA